MRVKTFVAMCGCWLCLAPVLPIWGLWTFAEWLVKSMESVRDWRWVQACVEAAERVERWQRIDPD